MQKRKARYVTKETVVTVMDVQVYENGLVDHRHLEWPGELDITNIIGQQIGDGVVVKVDSLKHEMKSFRLDIDKFYELAEEYTKDTRNSKKEEE